MQKSGPEQILRYLEDLEDMRHASKVSQKRRFDRFVVRGEAELVAIGTSDVTDKPLPIHIRDIGRGGIGFVSEEAVEAGEYFNVRFYESGFVVAERPIVVCHARQVESGLYLVGGQFVADTGLLILLGVDPDALRQSEERATDDQDDDDSITFISPSEVA